MMVLPVFIGMNLSEVNNKLTEVSIFQGKHTDFEGDWYKDVG